MTREEFINFIENTFDNYGLKKATKTDIGKEAYIPNIPQKEIFKQAGIDPLSGKKNVIIKELFSNKEFQITYYASLRKDGRPPEIRLGLHDIISYLNLGDEIIFTNNKKNIFVYNLSKLENQASDNDEIEENIFSQIDIKTLKEKVKNINTNPIQVQRQVNTYSRNNALRVLVKARANYSCEMPSCNYVGFEKNNGEKFIEVHHLTPLSEDGKDSIENTVALCPTCHRKLHYAHNKEELKENLKQHIKELN